MQSRSYKNEFLTIEDKAVYCEFDSIFKKEFYAIEEVDKKLVCAHAFANMCVNNSSTIENLKSMLKHYCEFDDIAFTNAHNYCYLMNLLDEFCNVAYSIVLSQEKVFIFKH